MKNLVRLSILIGCCIMHSKTATVNIVGPSAPGVIVKGPAMRAIIKGPDGSVISSVADAGAVTSSGHQAGATVVRETPAGVVHATNNHHHVPVVSLTSVVPLVAHHTHQAHHVLPLVYAVPVHGYGHAIHPVVPNYYHQG